MAYIKEGEGGGAHPFTKPNMIQSLVSFDMSSVHPAEILAAQPSARKKM